MKKRLLLYTQITNKSLYDLKFQFEFYLTSKLCYFLKLLIHFSVSVNLCVLSATIPHNICLDFCLWVHKTGLQKPHKTQNLTLCKNNDCNCKYSEANVSCKICP